VPTESWAGRLRGRLEQRGCDVASGDDQWTHARRLAVVVGARGTASRRYQGLWRGRHRSDDEAYRSTAAPTWDAVTMLRERCRRDGAPLWLTSSVPSPTLLNDGAYRSWATWRGRGEDYRRRPTPERSARRGARARVPRRRAPRTPGWRSGRGRRRLATSRRRTALRVRQVWRARALWPVRAGRRRSGRPTGVSGATRAAGELLSRVRRDELEAVANRRDDIGARRRGTTRPRGERGHGDQ